jgi:hypothetical protein
MALGRTAFRVHFQFFLLDSALLYLIKDKRVSLSILLIGFPHLTNMFLDWVNNSFQFFLLDSVYREPHYLVPVNVDLFQFFLLDSYAIDLHEIPGYKYILLVRLSILLIGFRTSGYGSIWTWNLRLTFNSSYWILSLIFYWVLWIVFIYSDYVGWVFKRFS